jgi:hypothetical protein
MLYKFTKYSGQTHVFSRFKMACNESSPRVIGASCPKIKQNLSPHSLLSHTHFKKPKMSLRGMLVLEGLNGL